MFAHPAAKPKTKREVCHAVGDAVSILRIWMGEIAIANIGFTAAGNRK
jgi:hypothetical protein